MSNPNAATLFNSLASQVGSLKELGRKQQDSGSAIDSDSIYRACVVLTISALDTFMHEKTAEVFLTRSANSPQVALDIANYLGTTVTRVTATDAPSVIRYYLSFKTLVAVYAIDKVATVSGADSSEIWRNIGIARGSRESRIRNALDLFVDRRNQISHEGDWDPTSLGFRHISEMHVQDCQETVRAVVEGFDTHWQ